MQTRGSYIIACLHIDKHTKARYHFIRIKNDKTAILNRDDIDGIESNNLKN